MLLTLAPPCACGCACVQYLVPDTLCVQIGMCPAPAPPSLMQELRASVEGLLTWPKTTLKKQLMRKQPL